jgi:hypothetical protein
MNGNFRDVASRIYEGDRYFQNILQFHGTKVSVNSLTLLR